MSGLVILADTGVLFIILCVFPLFTGFHYNLITFLLDNEKKMLISEVSPNYLVNAQKKCKSKTPNLQFNDFYCTVVLILVVVSSS